METPVNFESFKQPNFDVNKWINSVLNPNGSTTTPSSVEENANKLSQVIDSEIEATKGRIDGISEQMVIHIPRVARDFEVTHNEINLLQHEIVGGFNEAENVQKKTTASMTTLEKLDNIKTNLQETLQALQEADKWTSLAKQIEQLLDSGDVHKSYECILGMEKSLSVLDQSPAEDRRLILEEMKNRLEALATKHLIQAFDSNDTENSKLFFTMFSNLERTSQFIKYFENSEKIKLSQEWRNVCELMSFKESVVKYFDDILNHLHNKIQWCKAIFSQDSDSLALNVLLNLYAETIASLEPSLQYCFELEARKQPFLEVLIHFNETTHRFVHNLRQFIEASCSDPPEKGKIVNLLKVVYSPFIPQYNNYTKNTEAAISSKIKATVVAFNSSSMNSEATTALQERIDSAKRLLPEIILSIKEGEEKISIFNRGYAYYHFGKGINGGLEKFADWYEDVFRALSKSAYHPDKQRSLLENSLSFAEICGEILLQVVKLDQSMTANCQRVLMKLDTEVTNEWEMDYEIFIDKRIQQEVAQFFQKKDTLLSNALKKLKKLCQDATQLILKVTAEPIEAQLTKKFMLVDSSLKEAIPSEYITQIGEHLMLLPQNLDPFIAEGSSLSYAFDQSGEDDARSSVDYILSNLCHQVCEAYSERILRISYLTDGQAKQLGQDIDYLTSVLEDLGVKLTSDLADISKLMKIYSTINESSHVEKVSPRLLNSIKKMKIKPVSS